MTKTKFKKVCELGVSRLGELETKQPMAVNAFIQLFLTVEKQQPAPTRPHLMKYLITIRTISADLTCFISPVTPGFMVVTFNTKHCHSSFFVVLFF